MLVVAGEGMGGADAVVAGVVSWWEGERVLRELDERQECKMKRGM